MSRQANAKLTCSFVAVFAMCLGLACVLIVLQIGSDQTRSSQLQVSGDWSVATHSGQSQGTITLFPGGRIDSHDDYVGRWSLREGCLHVRFWKQETSSWIDYLRPQVEEHVFVPNLDPMTDAVTLQGQNVMLTRLAP